MSSLSVTPANDSVTSAKIVDGAIVNADVNASAAITYSKLSLSNSLLNADINSSAAIAWSKLATSTDVNTSGQVVDLTIPSEARGDIIYRGASSWGRLGAGTAGQALITSGAGADPYWGTPSISSATIAAQSLTIESGTNDTVISTTTQTVGSPTLTIPDFADTDDTFAFVTKASNLLNKTLTTPKIDDGDADVTITSANQTNASATITIPDCADAADEFVLKDTTQTLTNKTLTSPVINTATLAGSIIATTGSINDAGGDEYLKFVEATTPVTYAQITSGDTGVAPKIQGAGETNTDLHLLGSGTGNVYISDGTDPTKDINFELNGATTAKTMTIISSQTNDRSLTLPDATDTLVGKATTDTLTNKTIDADGTGNVISNVNANELDPVAVGNYGIPFLLTYNLTNQAAAVDIYNANAPFKFLVVKAWSDSTSADGGTWKLNNGAGGAGTDMTNAVTVAASADDFDEPTDYVYAECDIASSGSLSIVPDGGGALDAIIYIQAIKID